MSQETTGSPGNPTRSALADWLLEVSALLVVFPWLDQIVLAESQYGFKWRVAGGTFLLALGFLCVGLGIHALNRGKRISLFSCSAALIAAAALVSFWR
ncbi:MAG: hypothetical protein IT452_13100 [Planctomycetia bacterium]|nr:hypothetical protein [Planctomycetia bacterium]